METRVTSAQKELIDRAAAVQGQSVTEFVAITLQNAAKQAIEQATVWNLSQEQQKLFIDTLLDPPAPNEKLRAAHQRYQEYKAGAVGSRR